MRAPYFPSITLPSSRLARDLYAGALLSTLLAMTPKAFASEDDTGPADEALAVLSALGELPVAPNVDLKAPQPGGIEKPAEASTKEAQPAPAGQSIVLLGTEVAPGTSTRLSWGAQESFDGISASTPVLVVNGAQPGPVLCVTAAVHGDELNGIEMVRRLFYKIEPTKLKGTLIGVPIVNLDGFRRNSRYLTDRRDLNRFFPGNPKGSAASRIAHAFFNEVILHCEVLVDLHTGSFHRTNLPQLRADLKNPDVQALTEGFGNMVVLHSTGSKGTLRRAATNRGIPSVTLEAGEPLRLQNRAVDQGVKGLRHLLSHMSMYGKRNLRTEREPHYYKSLWIRADQGGILFANVSLGDRVKPETLLGTITDPITNVRSEIRSPQAGRILGMALNQVMMPGFAAFRIGIETTQEEIQAARAAKGIDDADKPPNDTAASNATATQADVPVAANVPAAPELADPAAAPEPSQLADKQLAVEPSEEDPVAEE